MYWCRSYSIIAWPLIYNGRAPQVWSLTGRIRVNELQDSASSGQKALLYSSMCWTDCYKSLTSVSWVSHQSGSSSVLSPSVSGPLGVHLSILPQCGVCGVWPLHPWLAALLPLLRSQSERCMKQLMEAETGWGGLHHISRLSLMWGPYQIGLLKRLVWKIQTLWLVWIMGSFCLIRVDPGWVRTVDNSQMAVNKSTVSTYCRNVSVSVWKYNKTWTLSVPVKILWVMIAGVECFSLFLFVCLFFLMFGVG